MKASRWKLVAALAIGTFVGWLAFTGRVRETRLQAQPPGEAGRKNAIKEAPPDRPEQNASDLGVAKNLQPLDPIPKHFNEFFDFYCIACHNDTTAKAKLSLESMPFDLTNEAWVRVHDQIAAGEMPPRKSEQPTAAERTRVLRSLDESITKTLTARHDQEGRVSLRRLNRREYDASLHDLLGISLPLKGMLPEDNPIRGFDTVSRGLQTSAAHFLAYQRAADRAIDESLPDAPFKSLVKRWTGREYVLSLFPVYRPMIDPFSNLDGDAFVLFAQLYGDQSMRTPDPTIPGRYRIRVGVHAVNSGGKPLTMRICKNLDRFQVEKGGHIIDIRNVYPGPSQVFEYEADLMFEASNRFVYFESLDLPIFPEFEKTRGAKGKEPLEQGFSGPGLAFDWAELTGPLNVEVGSQRLFGDLPREPYMPNGEPAPNNWRAWPLVGGEFSKYPIRARSANPKADADRLIRAFLPLALRRPAREEEAKHYVDFAHKVLDQGTPFEEAMRAAYKAILCSPHFLTYPEPPGPLDDYAVAARLARYLWSSVPDAELYSAAASKTLTKPEVLRAQTERMLKDPRSKRFAQGFSDQWLDLGKFLDMKPDELYVEYDEMLSWSMPMETRKYFDEILANDLSISTFFHSDWTFLNARLAKHYGIPELDGEELRKVALKPEYHRGGVITQASILKLTTNASYTSPIKRGAWIMDRMLGKTPPPPPPGPVEDAHG